MDVLASKPSRYTGSNSFRLMPTDEPHTAAATAEVSVAAGGHLTLVSYTWSHPDDGEQSGLLALGRGDDEAAAVALWADSWHQAPAARWLTGTVSDDVVTLSYTYAEEWEWVVRLDASSPDVLRLRMDNVVPRSVAPDEQSAGPYWAMRAELTPISPS